MGSRRMGLLCLRISKQSGITFIIFFPKYRHYGTFFKTLVSMNEKKSKNIKKFKMVVKKMEIFVTVELCWIGGLLYLKKLFYTLNR